MGMSSDLDFAAASRTMKANQRISIEGESPMSFWELFMALASAASIVSFAIALSSVFNGLATRRLIREMTAETHTRLDHSQESTQAFIAHSHESTQAVIARSHESTQALMNRSQESTQAFIAHSQESTQAFIARLHADTQALIREMQQETRQLLERMDERADDRHREVIEAIRTLRA